MSTASRYNRRDFMKVAAPAAIAVTQGIAPARPSESPDAQPKYLPVFFSDAEWASAGSGFTADVTEYKP